MSTSSRERPPSRSGSSPLPRAKAKRSRRRRRWPWLGPLVLVLGAATGAYWKQLWEWSRAVRSGDVVTPALAQLPRLVRPVDLNALSDAITEMDVTRARQLAEEYQRGSLSIAESHRLGVERARLSLYVGLTLIAGYFANDVGRRPFMKPDLRAWCMIAILCLTFLSTALAEVQDSAVISGLTVTGGVAVIDGDAVNSGVTVIGKDWRIAVPTSALTSGFASARLWTSGR